MQGSRFHQTVRELWSVLDTSARRNFLLLILSGTFAAVLEIVAIISLSQFVSSLIVPGIFNQSPRVQAILAELGVTDDLSFSFLFGATVIGLLLLSNLCAGLNAWLALRFVYWQERVLSSKLLTRYLGVPYVDLVKINSADLMKNLLSGALTQGVMRPLLTGSVYLNVTVMLIALIVLSDPMVALGMSVFVGLSYGSLSLFLKTYLHRLGEETHFFLQRRHRVSYEALAGAKPVKVLGREQAFIDRYIHYTKEACDRTVAKGGYEVLPRYFLEVVTFSGIIGIVLYQLWRGDRPEAIFPSLALYAFAGYRLIPAIHHVYSNWSEIQFHAKALTEVVSGLQMDQPELIRHVEPLRFENAITLENVSFGYTSDQTVLNNLTLKIKKGTSIGIVGPTGAGKSTLIDLLLGLLQPSSGHIAIDDHPLCETNIRAWQANLGFVPQDIFLLDDTLERNIAFGLSEHEIDKEAVQKASETAQISEFISELPEGYQTSIGERGVRLSGGQRQRVGIARAVYSDPQVVLLDEATSALDNVTERSVVQAIRELAKTRTVLTIAHRLTTVKACDHIFVLSSGCLVEQGSYEELMAKQGLFAQMALQSKDD